MKKLSTTIVVMFSVIAVMLLSSCDRYEKNKKFDPDGITQKITWKKVMTDSTKKDMVNYITIMGKDNCPKVTDVLIGRNFSILHAPDQLIKDVPAYHSCFYSGEQMVAENNYYRSSGATLWKAAQTTFVLKVLDPVSFEQANIQVETRDARMFSQVIIIIFYLLFVILTFVTFDDDEIGWSIFLFVLAVGMNVLCWFYLSLFVSGLLTALPILFTAGFIIASVIEANKKKAKTLVKENK